MRNRIRPWPSRHRRRLARARSRDGILPDSSSSRSRLQIRLALSPISVPRPAARGRLEMQLLLMPQEEIPPGKAPCALGTLERLLLGVGPLVPLQMLQPGKGSRASCTHMGTGLVCLWGRVLNCLSCCRGRWSRLLCRRGSSPRGRWAAGLSRGCTQKCGQPPSCSTRRLSSRLLLPSRRNVPLFPLVEFTAFGN